MGSLFSEQDESANYNHDYELPHEYSGAMNQTSIFPPDTQVRRHAQSIGNRLR